MSSVGGGANLEIPNDGLPGEDRDMYYAILDAIVALQRQADKAVTKGLKVVQINEKVAEEALQFKEDLVQVSTRHTCRTCRRCCPVGPYGASAAATTGTMPRMGCHPVAGAAGSSWVCS